MARRYVHFSARDLEDAILELSGLKKAEEVSVDDVVRGLLRDKLGVEYLSKLPVFKKFDELANISKSIIVVRDREETRGGEVADRVIFRSRPKRL